MKGKKVTGIWVLGSKHDKAKNCVTWERPFPDFSNADILIINTETLGIALKVDTALLQALSNEAGRSTFDMLMTAEKYIIVIMPLAPTDLTWLPIYPDYKPTVPIKTGKIPKKSALNEYLERVETTSYYFHHMNFAFVSETNPKPENAGKMYQNNYSAKLRNTHNILNATNQIVGGSFLLDIKYKQTYLGSSINEQHFVSSPILFLPPPTRINIEKGIDLLINIISQETQSETADSPQIKQLDSQLSPI